jgi:hypothetical protein
VWSQLFVKSATSGLLAEVRVQQRGVLRPHLLADPTRAEREEGSSSRLCTCTVSGADYRGAANTTVSGYACQVGVCFRAYPHPI